MGGLAYRVREEAPGSAQPPPGTIRVLRRGDRSLPYAWGVALTVSGGLIALAVTAAVPLGTLRARRPPAADLRAE